ncbi:bifunctional riboflavin kinase/FAD synthetase [Candidatus Atribacteria bacterium MT.SAG.1]|nr:bifunctional riboflavin kinase/FAD synthetase [Candidatus Atribacteria bacterium MT.SAG.1]
MEIIRYSKNIILPKKSRFIALGVFDGVHLGHQKLIKLTVDKAKKNDGISIVVTFDPHPDKIINPESDIFFLTTLGERINLIKDLDVDIFLIIKFDNKMSKMLPEDFLSKILADGLQTKELFVGFNYKFGFQGKGNVDFLREYGKLYKLKTNILKPMVIDKAIISSTIIKDYIKLGEIGKAKKLLGHNITISGKVVSGKSRGRKLLNFATANIETSLDKILPANGVYFVEIKIDDEKYYGLMNIGFKPTFKETERTIEVHIINFNKNIYNKKVVVNIFQRIRDEKYFKHPNLLKKQMGEDILVAHKMISNM